MCGINLTGSMNVEIFFRSTAWALTGFVFAVGAVGCKGTNMATKSNDVVASDRPLIAKAEVFKSGTNGVSRYRIPGVVVTIKGTLLAYCEARRNSSADWGEIEAHLRRSTDGGRTWEPPRQIAHLGSRIEGIPGKPGGEHEQTVNNPVAIVDRQTGAIEFLYCINYARCFSILSDDDGVTWSEPVEITPAFEPFRARYNWNVIATGPGHGIQLQSGRLVVPIWLAYGAAGQHSPSAAGTIYSDDHGRNWRAGDTAVPNEGDFANPNETMLTELSDGRVMLVSRNESKPNRKLVSYSPNGAAGWSTPAFHDQLWEPRCMAGLISYPAQPGTVLYSCPHTLPRDAGGKEKTSGGWGKRENLCIQLSRDNGQTWPIIKTLDAGPAAYSDFAVLSDGSALCLYEAANDIHAARCGLEWLTAKD